MIRIRYIPQVGLPGHILRYSWTGRAITATLYRGEEVVGQEAYDLSALQPGDEVAGVEPETLQLSPLISARCAEDGTLEVTLLHWYEGGEPTELGEEELDG